jgi:hypothetical protein
LFAEVEAGGVGDEDNSEEETEQSEPGNDPELGLISDVVVQNLFGMNVTFSVVSEAHGMTGGDRTTGAVGRGTQPPPITGTN